MPVYMCDGAAPTRRRPRGPGSRGGGGQFFWNVFRIARTIPPRNFGSLIV